MSGEVVSMEARLRERHLARVEAERQQKRDLAVAQLRALADSIELDPDGPSSLFVVYADESEPIVEVIGRPSWDELQQAGWAMKDAERSRYEDITISEAVARGHERRTHLADQLRAAREREQAEFPFRCAADRCGKRCKTERGLEQHQASCQWLKAERERNGL